MSETSIKFMDIPNRLSELRVLEELNKAFNIKINEYKGVGYIKRLDRGNNRYDLVVDYKKDYLIKRVEDKKFCDFGAYHIEIEREKIQYRRANIKYVICEMRQGSPMYGKVIKFHTLDGQNAMDIMVKVEGVHKLAINYVISNKMLSYVGFDRQSDAEKLLEELRQSKYAVQHADVYHHFHYVAPEEMEANRRREIQQNNVSVKKGNLKRKMPSRDNKALQQIKSLEKQLKEANKNIAKLTSQKREENQQSETIRDNSKGISKQHQVGEHISFDRRSAACNAVVPINDGAGFQHMGRYIQHPVFYPQPFISGNPYPLYPYYYPPPHM